MMNEANRRGYLDNLQLFKINAMGDLDNFLASQMPPCFYHLQRLYPHTMRLLAQHLGYERLFKHLERELLLPRWNGKLDPLLHTYDADPVYLYPVLSKLVLIVPLKYLPDILDGEHRRHVTAMEPAGAPP